MDCHNTAVSTIWPEGDSRAIFAAISANCQEEVCMTPRYLANIRLIVLSGIPDVYGSVSGEVLHICAVSGVCDRVWPVLLRQGGNASRR